jgi:type IV pilus biogenesis protein CpaD/CtpE
MVAFRIFRARRPHVVRWAVIAVLGLAGCTSASEVPSLATTRTCPQWVNFPIDDHSNAGSPYLGCTNANNLQTMIATPGDLEHGRELGPANGERATLGVETYQQGKIKDFSNANAPAPVFFAPGGGGQ